MAAREKFTSYELWAEREIGELRATIQDFKRQYQVDRELLTLYDNRLVELLRQIGALRNKYEPSAPPPPPPQYDDYGQRRPPPPHSCRFPMLRIHDMPRSRAELQLAYRSACKIWHPDAGGSHEQMLKLQQEFEYCAHLFAIDEASRAGRPRPSNPYADRYTKA